MKKLINRLFGGPKQTKAAPTEERAAPAQNQQLGAGTSRQPSTFRPLNELEQMLVEAATDPSKRNAFQKGFLEAEVYAATPDAPDAEGMRTLKAGEQLKLLNVPGPDGQPVAAIFTAEARIAEVFGPGYGFLLFRGEALLEIVAKTGAFLNPGLPYRVHWGPDAVAAMLGRPVGRTITKDTKVLLGSPSEPPVQLIAELRETLGSHPRIAEAWLALASWPETGEQAWYLDVRTNLSPADVSELMSPVFKRANFAGRYLDMIVKKPDETGGIGIRVAPLSIN